MVESTTEAIFASYLFHDIPEDKRLRLIFGVSFHDDRNKEPFMALKVWC